MKEGDIFERSICDWEEMKELILKGIFEGVQELESFSILDVPDVVISRVALVVSAVEKSGIRIDWLDRLIGEVSSRWDYAALAQQEEHLSIWVTELHEELGRAETTWRDSCPDGT